MHKKLKSSATTNRALALTMLPSFRVCVLTNSWPCVGRILLFLAAYNIITIPMTKQPFKHKKHIFSYY